MKVNITAETTGQEVITDYIVPSLKATLAGDIKPETIKTQVLNKESKWIDFDPSKVKFTYNQ